MNNTKLYSAKVCKWIPNRPNGETEAKWVVWVNGKPVAEFDRHQQGEALMHLAGILMKMSIGGDV